MGVGAAGRIGRVEVESVSAAPWCVCVCVQVKGQSGSLSLHYSRRRVRSGHCTHSRPVGGSNELE